MKAPGSKSMSVPTGPTGILSSTRGGVKPGGKSVRGSKSSLKGVQMKRALGGKR